MKWFKLGLETQENVLPLPPSLTASNVVQDFLTALYKHIMTTLHRRFDKGVMQMTRVDFVLTVPAIWSDAAKKKTEDAAVRAGLRNEHQLELLSEPESAAVYTLKNLESAHSQIRVGDRIVVCDAGGGTVDLISYEVQKISPQLSVSKLTDVLGSTLESRPPSDRGNIVECTAGTGEFCGSTFSTYEPLPKPLPPRCQRAFFVMLWQYSNTPWFLPQFLHGPKVSAYCIKVDQEFEKLFATRMASHYSRLNPIHRQQVAKNFELCKIAFRDDPQTPTFYVNVPVSPSDRPNG